jgi:uncharacterized membrane protein
MPFCSQCGNQVAGSDVFCAKCGARQPGAQQQPPGRSDPLAGITPRTASILCYVPGIGWLASIVVLASDKFRNDRGVKFHAFQGLYLFVAWLISDRVLHPMFARLTFDYQLYHLVDLALLGMSIFMMIKAAHNQTFSLPLFGELAERSLNDR